MSSIFSGNPNKTIKSYQNEAIAMKNNCYIKRHRSRQGHLGFCAPGPEIEKIGHGKWWVIHVRSKFRTEHSWYGLTNSISEAHGWQRCPFVSRARRRVGSHWTMSHRQSCQPWSPLSQSSSSSSSHSSPQSSSPHSSSPGARQLYCQESWPSALRPRNQLG